MISRLASVAVVVACGALGVALPDSLLVGGVAWLAFVFCVLAGWGSLLARVARVDEPDLGLRAMWGLAVYLALAGILLMLGICSRPVVLVVMAIGAIGFCWRELTTEQPLVDDLRAALARARAHPVVAYVAILVGAAVLVHVIGAVVHLDRNPWDDDIAYTAFVRRLLDTGDLIEPFSFRRLAAYGGQTALQALVGARGSLASVHALDQGLCFALVFVLVLGHARSLKVGPFWLVVLVLVLVLMPDISINTASYWSGAACFLALYRTAAAGELVPTALLGVATCTLRMNYVPVVVLFLVFTLHAQRASRRTWLRMAGIGVVAVLPWCVAAYLSSETFLFPFMKGTWNAGLELGPSGWTWVDELGLFAVTAINTQPLAMLVVAPLIAFTQDTRPSRPLVGLFIASVVGFALLVHSFTDADSASLWRYAFGYTLPLMIIFAVEAGDETADSPIRLVPLARWVLVAAVLVQLVTSRTGHVKEFASVFADIREAAAIDRHGDPNAAVERTRYAAMQAAVPAGARLFVMLDDPHYLDYARNDISNADVPGFASPGTQLPAFRGHEALRSYLLAQGIRYVAFVRSEHSRYAFRREFWVWRVFNDAEFFQAMSAYSIDMIESLTALALTTPALHDKDGLVVLDLGDTPAPLVTPDPAVEAKVRSEFLLGLARREGLEREWALTTRPGLSFLDGLSGLTFAQPGDDARWTDVAATDPNPTRGVPVRWMYRRAHLRLRASQDMHLVLRGHVSVNQLYSRPRLDVSLDGILLTSVTADESGAFTIDVTITKAQLARWADLYIVFNAIGQPERDVRELKLARLEDVTWEPR